jgi:hypothetical protein
VSRKWWGVVVIAFVVGVISITLGFVLPKLDSFLENILAAVAVSAFAFAIAVLLIEGPVLTRERRFQEVISVAARSVAQINEEIALMVVREIGEYLASGLDSVIDLYGEERSDWKDFKPLLQQVFQCAKRVPEKGLPDKNILLSEEDYRSYVKGARSLVERIRSALGSDWEVQSHLLELIERLNKVEECITKAEYPSTVRDEKMRYAALGVLGEALIDLIEACPKIED